MDWKILIGFVLYPVFSSSLHIPSCLIMIVFRSLGLSSRYELCIEAGSEADEKRNNAFHPDRLITFALLILWIGRRLLR